MMEVVVTTGAISRAKLQSDCYQWQTNTQLCTDQMPFPSPNHQCLAAHCPHVFLLSRVDSCFHSVWWQNVDLYGICNYLLKV